MTQTKMSAKETNEIYEHMTKDSAWYTTDHPELTEYTVGTNKMTVATVLAIDIPDEEAYANVMAIKRAVNNTYLKGIDPECVPELVETIKTVHSVLSGWNNTEGSKYKYANLIDYLNTALTKSLIK